MSPPRKKTARDRFGFPPSDLPVGYLPGKEEVAAYFFKIQNENPKCSMSENVDIVYQKLIEMWARVNVNLPLLSEKVVKFKITKYIQKVRDFNHAKNLSVKQRTTMQTERGYLFDIAACNCDLPQADCNSW